MKIFRRSGLSCRVFSNLRGVGLPAWLCAVVLFFALGLAPGTLRAGMAVLDDSDLGGISGQAGVSLNLDGGAQVYYDILKFSDSQTTPNWIELHDVKMDDGAGGNFFFSTFLKDEPTGLVTNFLTYYTVTAPDATKAAYTWAANAYEILNDTNVQNGTIAGLEEGMKRVTADPIFYDVATGTAAAPGPGEGITYINIRDTSGINPRWTSVGNFVFNAYSTNITNTAYLSNTVGHYMTANALDNAGLIAALGLSAGFVYSDPSTWASDDVTKLAMTNDNPSSVVLNYMTAHSLDNAGLIAALGLSATFDSTNLSTWTFDDVTKLATETGGDSALITLVSAYAAVPGDFHLQTQPLGSLAVDAWRQGPSLSRFWAHAGQGLSFDYQTTITADALTYAYNTTAAGALRLSNLTIAGSATGAPATPSSWVFSDNFKIGTIGDSDVYADTDNDPLTPDVLVFTGNKPATMDAATVGGVTSVYMSLPAAGTVRVAEVNFGGNNFGPIAIDGIQFHRLDIKLTP